VQIAIRAQLPITIPLRAILTIKLLNYYRVASDDHPTSLGFRPYLLAIDQNSKEVWRVVVPHKISEYDSLVTIDRESLQIRIGQYTKML